FAVSNWIRLRRVSSDLHSCYGEWPSERISILKTTLSSRSGAGVRRMCARAIYAELAMRVSPAEELDCAAQVPPPMPLELRRNLALPFNTHHAVQVHGFAGFYSRRQMPVDRASRELA